MKRTFEEKKMRKLSRTKLWLLITFIVSIQAIAATNLSVITDPSKGADKNLWKGLKSYQVPESIMGTVNVEDPQLAFSSPYEHIFFNTPEFVLCFDHCEHSSNAEVLKKDETFNLVYRRPRWYNNKRTDRHNSKLIQQSNVYYWLTRLFDMTSGLGFTPEEKLEVYVGRQIEDISGGGNLENNAFFNPMDNTLSFLPQGNGLLTRIMAGKLRPSALDPSVAVHEAGHFVFDQLTGGESINQEIGGLNEGFADYLAMTLLDTESIGNVMMSGKPLRQLSTKRYGRKMEVHDLGNVFASALLTVRKEVSDKKNFDKAVLESVKKISADPYMTAFSWSEVFFETLGEFQLGQDVLDSAREVFTSRNLTGSYKSLDKAKMLQSRPSTSWMSIAFTEIVPLDLADEYGVPTSNTRKLTLVEEVDLSEMNENGERYSLIKMAWSEDKKVTPFWIFFENSSNNVLGAWDLSLNLIKDKEGLKLVQAATEKLADINKFKKLDNIETMSQVIIGSKALVKTKVKKIEDTFLNVNGSPIAVIKRSGKLKLKFLGRLASLIVKPLKSFKSFVYYTSKDKSFEGKLPRINKDEYLLGYQFSLKSGVSEKLLVEQVK